MDAAAGTPPTRRGFLETACVASGCAACFLAGAPVVAYLGSGSGDVLKGPQKVGSSTDVPEGGSKLVKLGALFALVIRSGGRLHAVNATCTHLGCIIEWDGPASQIKCNCHGAKFQCDGTKISGPAKNQDRLKIREEEGRIILDLE